MMFHLLFGVVAAVLVLPGDVASEDRPSGDMTFERDIQGIVGGSETAQNKYRWMAALFFKGKFDCGGSLIKGSNQFYYILTAAHCVHGRTKSSFDVYLGAHDITNLSQPSVQKFKVSQIIKNPRYVDSTLMWDSALLKLDGTPRMTNTVRTGTLTSRDVRRGHTVTVAGWGRLRENGPISSTLQEINVPVLRHRSCKSVYNNYRRGNMICAGVLAGDIDSCSGDSGGPMMIPSRGVMQLVGIVSFGEGCAKPNRPGVYSNVFKSLGFINRIING